jgi:hypothetical protein
LRKVAVFVALLGSSCRQQTYDCCYQEISNGSTYRALLFLRDGPAVNPYVTFLHITPISQPQRYTDRSTLAIALRGNYPVEARWLDLQSLEVSCEKCTPDRVYVYHSQCQGVRVALLLGADRLPAVETERGGQPRQ